MKSQGIWTLIGAVLFAMAQTGCSIPSIHPIATEDVMIDDEQLEGTWADAEATVVARVERVSAGLFNVSTTFTSGDADKPAQRHVLEARLVKLGEHRYVDMILQEDQRKKLVQDHNFFVVPTHQFLRFAREDDRLTLLAPDYDRFKDLIRETGLAHARIESGGTADMVLTASTRELQAFFRAHGSDDRLFDSTIELRRVNR